MISFYDEEVVYRIRTEVEAWLGVSRMTIWRYRRAGMPWIDVRGRIPFPEPDVHPARHLGATPALHRGGLGPGGARGGLGSAARTSPVVVRPPFDSASCGRGSTRGAFTDLAELLGAAREEAVATRART